MTRASGVLLHPSSLPGRGIGDLGEEARRFVDWLVDAGQTLWQVLPLGPVGDGDSPYSGLSAFAGNPLLISLGALAAQGLLHADELTAHPVGAEPIEYPVLARWKHAGCGRRTVAFRAGAAPALEAEFAAFRERSSAWLDDLRAVPGAARTVQRRALDALGGGAPRARAGGARAMGRELADEVERHAFVQFLFDRQWQALRAHAHGRGVRIIGDIPIFVAHDSADVWAHRRPLPARRARRARAWWPACRPTTSARPASSGAIRSTAGTRMAARRLSLVDRRASAPTLELVDLVRIDHFRGFEALLGGPGRRSRPR